MDFGTRIKRSLRRLQCITARCYCATIRAAGVLISVADSAPARMHKNGDSTQPLLAMMLSRRIIALHYLTKSSVMAKRRAALRVPTRESNKITTMITCPPLIQALTILSMRIPTRMSRTLRVCLPAHVPSRLRTQKLAPVFAVVGYFLFSASRRISIVRRSRCASTCPALFCASFAIGYR